MSKIGIDKRVQYMQEQMKSYPLSDLHKKGTVKLFLGEILCLKSLAQKGNFHELAERLKRAEEKILAMPEKGRKD